MYTATAFGISSHHDIAASLSLFIVSYASLRLLGFSDALRQKAQDGRPKLAAIAKRLAFIACTCM